MGPNECKYCGLHATWHIDEDTFFACGTIYAGRGDYWNESTGCEEIMRSRERIQRAVEVLEGAERYDIITGYESYMERRSDGEFIEHEEADQALEILRGNSPESPDSSPVTADQLATEDYFEAVRQQVPWMTSIEHIKGLVEGYRRCGVMVWQTAEEIRKVHGGEYGKAD